MTSRLFYGMGLGIGGVCLYGVFSKREPFSYYDFHLQSKLNDLYREKGWQGLEGKILTVRQLSLATGKIDPKNVIFMTELGDEFQRAELNDKDRIHITKDGKLFIYI